MSKKNKLGALGNNRIIGGNLANFTNKIGFIHIPKCGGCSVGRYLHHIGRWHSIDHVDKTYAAEPFLPMHNYKFFTIIRHPVDWILSGYKMWKQRHGYQLTFDEHVDALLSDYIPDIHSNDFDWYWHCKILPDQHIKGFSVTVCKLEEIHKLPVFLNEFFPEALHFEIPVDNATDKEYISISNSTYDKIKNFAGAYADTYGYEL